MNASAPGWREHAEGLAPDLLALEAMRAMIDDDPEPMEAFIARLDALAEREDGAEQLDELMSALTRFAVIFGRKVHGGRLLQVLTEMHEDVRRHIADYEPSGGDR